MLNINEQILERLGRLEREIFKTLWLSHNRIVPKIVLQEKFWQAEARSNTLQVHLSRLRRKLATLAPQFNIETITRAGYRLRTN